MQQCAREHNIAENNLTETIHVFHMMKKEL